MATRTRATVYPLSGLWKVTPESPQPDTRPPPARRARWGARGEERIRGKIQKSRQGPRARARVRRRPRGLGGGRARRRRRRGGRRGPGPGASARRRSFAPRRGARRRGRRTPRRSWGSNRARRRRPRGVQGVVRVRARPRRRRHRRRRARAVAPRRAGKGARRGTRARRARRRAASAPRIAPEGRRDADAWDASREVTQAAVDSCAVAEPPSIGRRLSTKNQLARRAIACDARPRGAAAKGSRGRARRRRQRGPHANGRLRDARDAHARTGGAPRVKDWQAPGRPWPSHPNPATIFPSDEDANKFTLFEDYYW